MSTITTPLGKLEKIRVREAWPDEARNFTPWLATAGIELLSDELGVDLKVITQEHAVGRYSLDILAAELSEDGTEDDKLLVVIENQFGATDHDHLGKLMTYAAGVGDEAIGARTVIWVAEQFREEHRLALDWLNRISQSSVRFYRVQLELYKIGDSAPAPALNVLVRPNEIARARQAAPAEENSERSLLYIEYWTAFKALCTNQNGIFRLQTPRPQYWIESPLGRSGFYLSFLANRKKRWIGCEFNIRTSDPKTSLESLEIYREVIESEIGYGALDWTPVSSKSSKVELAIQGRDPSERNDWEAQHKLLFAIGEKFHRAFAPRVKAL